jgi:hypothetical protein
VNKKRARTHTANDPATLPLTVRRWPGTAGWAPETGLSAPNPRAIGQGLLLDHEPPLTNGRYGAALAKGSRIPGGLQDRGPRGARLFSCAGILAHCLLTKNSTPAPAHELLSVSRSRRTTKNQPPRTNRPQPGDRRFPVISAGQGFLGWGRADSGVSENPRVGGSIVRFRPGHHQNQEQALVFGRAGS